MSAHIPVLPHTVRLQYLAEGSANIVYHIIQSQTTSYFSPSSSELPSYGSNTPPPTEIEDDGTDITQWMISNEQLEGKLLRLRKDVGYGTGYEETIQNFNTLIRPLFEPEELVDQLLVKLPVGLVETLNEQLKKDEQNVIDKYRRPAWRHGVYLSSNEPYGLLVTDMTANSFQHSRRATMATLVELKPKWLVQSPSAPANARRCRTCALRDMREHNATYRPDGNVNRPCPLLLVSEKFEDLYRVAGCIKTSVNQTRLARALYRHKTLLGLKRLQERVADVGLHGPPETSQDLSIAMTLRDCSAFVKVYSTWPPFYFMGQPD